MKSNLPFSHPSSFSLPESTRERLSRRAAAPFHSAVRVWGQVGLLFLFMALLASCKPAVPRDIIQPDDMEDLLYDYHLADGVAQQLPQGGVDANVVALRTSVLKEHGVTQAEFDSSMVYYMRHADRLHDIYEHLADRLQDDARSLGASASDLGGVGGSSASGDTVNVWRGQTAVTLIPNEPFNLFSFSLRTDSTFHRGDKVMLQFSANFIFQDGMRDGIAYLAVTYRNDSVAARNMHISSSSSYTLLLDDNDSLGIKDIRGFFLLNKSQDANTSLTTLRLMSIYDIRLYRNRQSKQQPQPATPAGAAPAAPAGSPAPAPAPATPMTPSGSSAPVGNPIPAGSSAPAGSRPPAVPLTPVGSAPAGPPKTASAH